MVYVDVPHDMPERGFIFSATFCYFFIISLFRFVFEIANNNCKKWNWYFRTKLPLTRWEPSNNSFCLSNFIFAIPPYLRLRCVFAPHRPTARRASRKMERLRQVNGKLFTVVPKWCNFACSCNSISCQRKRASLCSPIVVKHPQKDTPLSPSLSPKASLFLSLPHLNEARTKSPLGQLESFVQIVWQFLPFRLCAPSARL